MLWSIANPPESSTSSSTTLPALTSSASPSAGPSRARSNRRDCSTIASLQPNNSHGNSRSSSRKSTSKADKTGYDKRRQAAREPARPRESQSGSLPIPQCIPSDLRRDAGVVAPAPRPTRAQVRQRPGAQGGDDDDVKAEVIWRIERRAGSGAADRADPRLTPGLRSARRSS